MAQRRRRNRNQRARRAELVDDGAAVVQGSVRTVNSWSPDQIRAAERATDTGNLYYAATLCEWILGDDRVSGALTTRLDQLFGLEPAFEPADSSARAKQAAELYQRDHWRMHFESELTEFHSMALLLGVSLARNAWQTMEGHDDRIIPVLDVWHPQSLRYDRYRGGWFTRDDKFTEHHVVAGDGEWILHTPYSKHRPWARGLWRKLSWWVMLKYYARIDWARHSEKGSVLVASSSEAATRADRQQLAEAFVQAGSQGIMSLPVGWDAKLIEVAANTRQIYEAQIELANKGISIAIRGGNLSSDVEGGSRAAAEVQERTGDNAKLRFDAQSLTTTLHDQAAVWWAEFNLGDRALAPWVKYPVTIQDDLEKKSRTIVSLSDSIDRFEAMGFEVDDQALIDEFDLRFLKPRNGRGRDRAPQRMMEREPEPGPSNVAPSHGVSRGGIVLQSGADVSENRGFVNGQLYVDALVERATDAGIQALQPTLDAVLEELDAARDYEDLRERLRARYEQLDPEELSELVGSVMLLGELAGRAAVNEDA